MADGMGTVDLGFLEEVKTDSSWKLLSAFFPSKVGGKPSWLNLKSLPSTNDLKCNVCEKPCTFLMQIYCPIENRADCFHRTIYIFLCKNSECCKKNSSDNFIVFRCQLPRENEFYNYEPPDYENYDSLTNYPGADLYNKLCVICGCLGNKRCSGCHETTYCSKDHQKIDWLYGHKRECGKSSYNHSTAIANFVFPESELIMESEDLSDIEDSSVKAKSDQERMEEYKKFIRSQNYSNASDLKFVEKELNEFANKEDDLFSKFRRRLSNYPEQILRYERGGQPLLASSEYTPCEIQKCSCGANRLFEFQVMPHLLKYLNIDKLEHSIDWATLIIYTCSESCDNGPVYHREISWKQDFSNHMS